MLQSGLNIVLGVSAVLVAYVAAAEPPSGVKPLESIGRMSDQPFGLALGGRSLFARQATCPVTFRTCSALLMPMSSSDAVASQLRGVQMDFAAGLRSNA